MNISDIEEWYEDIILDLDAQNTTHLDKIFELAKQNFISTKDENDIKTMRSEQKKDQYMIKRLGETLQQLSFEFYNKQNIGDKNIHEKLAVVDDFYRGVVSSIDNEYHDRKQISHLGFLNYSSSHLGNESWQDIVIREERDRDRLLKEELEKELWQEKREYEERIQTIAIETELERIKKCEEKKIKRNTRKRINKL